MLKAKFKIIFAILSISFLISCADEVKDYFFYWMPLNTGTNKALTDISIYGDSFVLICGEMGTLIKSENEGDSFSTLNVGVNESFLSVFSLNQSTFFTSRLGLFKSENAGATFSNCFSNQSASIQDIHFFDKLNGLIYKGNIYKTYDGGKTWHEKNTYTNFANIIEVPEKNVVYIAGGSIYDQVNFSEISKSTDQGETWNKLNLPDEISKYCISAIDFLNDSIGIIATYNKDIFQTKDGGKSWILLNHFDNFSTINSLLYADSNQIYMLSDNQIYNSTYLFKYWNTIYYQPNKYVLNKIVKNKSGILFVIGENGFAMKYDYY